MLSVFHFKTCKVIRAIFVRSKERKEIEIILTFPYF